MTEPEKMALTSLEIATEKREELKRCLGDAFPEVFAEGAIDFEQLRRVLGDWIEPGKERFGLNWPGKAECMKIIQQPSVATLKPVREESVDFDETENLFVEGDNLEVLKLLQKSYFGKVKMIYIDPPYNTGNEFIYPDKYSETLETYLSYTRQTDNEGRKFSTNTEASGRYHTRWLNMMYPRLYLARNLLLEDGIVFISVDDHEQSNLRALCDGVFGEENFVECFVWKKSYGGGPKEKYAVTQHEYVLMYAKNIIELPSFWLPYDPKKIDRYYKGRDQYYETRGPYRIKPLEATKSMDDRPNLNYGVPIQDVGEIWPKRQWLWGKERVVNALEKGEVIVVGDGDGRTLNYKQYLRDEDGEERGEKPFSVIEGIYTQRGTDDLRALFDDKVVLQFPKPVDLIFSFVAIAASNDRNAIVLDFFAGSATTAQAVLKHNADQKTSLRFMMVQLPEPSDDGSVAKNAGFQTIADIGKDRIRRAAKKIAAERDGQLDFEGNGTLDLGFKVFKLDRSNFKTWQGDADAFDESGEQLEMHVEHLSSDGSTEDVLYELLLKVGNPLTIKVETVEMAGKQVFAIDDGALLICLEKEVTPELIDALADAEPSQVICLDAAFKGNDQLKANAVLTFKARAQAEESEIVFRTV